jgi:hypothetical protein
MPYLTSVSLQQVGSRPVSGGEATVLVQWTFGNLIPDVVEISVLGGSNVDPEFHRVIISEARTETTFNLVARSTPTFLSISVSPRILSDGVLTDKMVDDFGQLQYWESFSLYSQLTVAAQKSGHSAIPTPNIGNVDIAFGKFTVHWTTPPIGHFNATLTPGIDAFRGQIELDGTDRLFTQDRMPEGRYRFSIQGCSLGLFGSTCSDWVGTDIVIPPELGFQPWRRWFPLPGQAVFDRDKQRITAVSRAPGNLDLFVIGNDNRVYSTYWPNADGHWNPEWFPIRGQAVFDRDKQQIAAVSRAPGNLDLFVIGNDNRVYSTYWNDVGGWSPNEWFPLPGQAVFDHDKQQITAVSRAPGNLDLFVIGNDNRVYSTFFD